MEVILQQLGHGSKTQELLLVGFIKPHNIVNRILSLHAIINQEVITHHVEITVELQIAVIHVLMEQLI